MNTLIIHPYDESTAELEKVYANKSVDVLHRRNVSREDVENALHDGNYDRVILLGHGTPEGLVNMWTGEHVFDPEMYRSSVIPRKMEVVAIWCNANLFFLKWDEPSSVFSTGMFISEVREARDYSLYEADEEVIRKQFELFSEVLSTAAYLPIAEIRDYIDLNYTGQDEVTRFNREQMLL